MLAGYPQGLLFKKVIKMKEKEEAKDSYRTSTTIDLAEASDSTTEPSSPELSRRRFFKTAGAAGLLGAMGGVALGPMAPQVFAQQGQYDFPQPADLRPGGQLDSRFPVSFAEPVSQGLRLVLEFFTALNQRDVQGMANTLHVALI